MVDSHLSLTSQQGGEVPVLPVIVSQGQDLLHLDLVVSLGGKSELRAQEVGKVLYSHIEATGIVR